jgi:predicted HNH restriction endonuclease
MASRFNILSPSDEAVIDAINRYAWPRWEGKTQALKRAHYYERVGRFSSWYFCEMCGERGLHKSGINVHHNIPRIPATGWDDLLSWIRRTLCPADQLSILCLECHKLVHSGDARVRADRKKTKTKKAKKHAKLS